MIVVCVLFYCQGHWNYDHGRTTDMNHGGEKQYSSANLQYHRKNLSSSPSELRHPLLRLNRTESQNSSEGNTIDMVRLMRRKEESRLSKMNNYQELYNKHFDGNIIRNYNDYHYGKNGTQKQVFSPLQRDPYGSKSPRQLSPRQRSMLQTSQRAFLRSTFRPSQINLLHEMDGSARNRVIGWLLMVVFIIIYLQFVVLGGYLLNERCLLYGSDERILEWDKQFESIPYFTITLFIYALSQCLHHFAIYLINSKAQQNSHNASFSLLIDREAASLRYILRCRDFTSQSSSLMERAIKSPKFTLVVIILSTVVCVYGSVQCFYQSQLRFLYQYATYNQYDSQTNYSLLQIIFYLLIMPDVMSYVFFQSMHLAHYNTDSSIFNNNNQIQLHHNNNLNQPITNPFHQKQHNSSRQQQQHNHHYDIKHDSFTIPPLTVFNLHSWWVKMSLVIFMISIVYSLLRGKWWLAIIVFGKLELSFVKNKYKIDLFWVEFISKGIIVVMTGGLLVYQWWASIVMNQNNYGSISNKSNLDSNNVNTNTNNNQSQISYSIISFTAIFMPTIAMTISGLLSRLLASHYLREQLYKHLFQQMSIISSTIIGSLMLSYVFYQYIFDSLPVDYVSVLFIIFMQIGLLVCICLEGNSRQQIDLDAQQRLSESCQIYQMHHYQI